MPADGQWGRRRSADALECRGSVANPPIFENRFEVQNPIRRKTPSPFQHLSLKPLKPHGFVTFFEVLVRLNNCSEQHSALNFSAPEVQYLNGIFTPTNVYQGQASYARPGSNPERQLLLVPKSHARAMPNSKTCKMASWLLVHTNASDFEDGNSNSPEFFGAPVGCITDQSIVKKVFSDGDATFSFELQQAELQAPHGSPEPWQQGSMKLSLSECEAPDLAFSVGTVEQADAYALDACDCFGEAHSAVAPVDEESNAAVPRNAEGFFNNGSAAWLREVSVSCSAGKSI